MASRDKSSESALLRPQDLVEKEDAKSALQRISVVCGRDTADLIRDRLGGEKCEKTPAQLVYATLSKILDERLKEGIQDLVTNAQLECNSD